MSEHNHAYVLQNKYFAYGHFMMSAVHSEMPYLSHILRENNLLNSGSLAIGELENFTADG